MPVTVTVATFNTDLVSKERVQEPLDGNCTYSPLKISTSSSTSSKTLLPEKNDLPAPKLLQSNAQQWRCGTKLLMIFLDR